MEIKKHISFKHNKAPELISYLVENNIPFKEDSQLVSLDIYESNPHWRYINKYVQNRKLICLSETIYSMDELMVAEWMCVRSQWRCGYPQPESKFGYLDVTYSLSGHCAHCGNGLVQANNFQLKSAPKWNKRHFMMLNWVDDEFFINGTAKKVLEDKLISGIKFLGVNNKNGNMVLPDTYQLGISHFLENGLDENDPSVLEIQICPDCGRNKYHPSGIGTYAFRKEIFHQVPDIVKSSEVFGWGCNASHLIIINQKVYRAIIENGLERGLVFSPINLV